MKTVGRGYWLAVLIVIGVIVDRAGAAIKTDRKREGGGEKGETIEGEGVREGTVFPVGNVADNFNVKQPEPAYGKACINHVTRHRRSSLRCGHSFNSITIYKIMIYRARLIKTA